MTSLVERILTPDGSDGVACGRKFYVFPPVLSYRELRATQERSPRAYCGLPVAGK